MSANEDLAAALSLCAAANQAWVVGDWSGGYGTLLSGADDVTIYGPFGGAAVEGAIWAQRGAQVAGQFSNGTSKLTLVRHYASGDLLVLVTLEEQIADIAGLSNRPWSLRVTQVLRREAGNWKVVHRHADPLVATRTIKQALAMAAGESRSDGPSSPL